MNKKGHGTREWLNGLRGKKVEVNDIVPFAMLGFVAYKNSVRLQMAAEKLSDISLKISLQIIALEEMAKPLMVYELVPALEEEFEIEDETVEAFIKDFFFHAAKQGSISNYGENFGRLGYENKLTEEELKRLESIKQGGFYTETNDVTGKIAVPFDSLRIDKTLSEKIEKILKEKGVSLGEIYHHPIRALEFYLSHAILQKFSIKAETVAFLKYADFTRVDSFDSLLDLVNNFEQEPVNGELLVDDNHPEAGMKTFVLLTKLGIKKIPGQVDVVGASMYENFENNDEAKIKMGTLKKLVYERIGKEDVIKKIKDCIEIQGITFEKPSFLNRLKALFSG